ncbi:MAG: hypothetical protein FRX49_02636 [Trebouxia sp. A1-2]|nr:MAG: hypothetical protein FRX49_02636 [Trebouxia sp. A1-2]
MLARCTMKVALITGCSSGLGKALARALHTGSWNAHSAAGFRVFATSRNTGDLQDLMLEGIDALQLDVTDADSVKSAVDHIEKEAGGIDLLVCNAGILRIGPIVEQDLSEVKAVIDTNVYGTLLCARAVAPVMIRQRSGVIAAVGSITASLTAPYCGIYSASKAATRSMIEAMRLEMSPYNVKATFIEAGMFRSNLIHKSTFDISQYTAEKSCWSRGASGIEAVVRYIQESSTSTAEQVAAAVARQLCQKHGPPAHFLVADKTWINKFMGFIYMFVSPDAVHRLFTSKYGLSKKW